MSILRPATHVDAPAIATILSNWIDENDWLPVVHSMDDRRGFGTFLIDRTDVTVAETAAGVAGFLARQEQEVHALYVAAGARGQGLGQDLLDGAKRTTPCLKLWTHRSNRAARRFYRREGFEEAFGTDGSGNDEKLPDLRMIWTAEAA